MAKNGELDNQLDGQMSINDILDPPKAMVAVSNIFARARQMMTLNEQKTFVYALTRIRYTEPAKSNYVRLDKKVLSQVLGLTTKDTDHLSENLYDEIKDLPSHSYIQIADKDLGLYSNGFIISSVTKFKNFVRLHFNSEYLPLFTNLSDQYITLWSEDIFGMHSVRSVKFYELLRQMSYSKYEDGDGIYSYAWGIKAFKTMFGIPKEGKGSYMREKGGFDRTNFERRVIEPLCDDLAKCKMINLLIQPDGKPYVKIKHGGMVDGYQFFWTLSAHPAVASASEVRQMGAKQDEDGQVVKVAKDIMKGKQKPKKQEQKPKNGFHNFPQRQYDYDKLEKLLLKASSSETKGTL